MQSEPPSYNEIQKSSLQPSIVTTVHVPAVTLDNTEPLPNCFCCNVKTGLYIYLAFALVCAAASAIIQGGGWIALALLLLNVFAVYKESSVMLKVFAALNIIGLILTDILFALLIVALKHTTSISASNNPNGAKDPKAIDENTLYLLIGIFALQNILNIVVVLHMRKLWQYIDKRNASALTTTV